METKPTHEQAQLQLQLFEQRREPRLRQARDWFFKNYIVENLDDAMRIAPMGSEGGQFAMMVLLIGTKPAPCSTMACCTKTCFLKPRASFSACGRAQKR